jgi:hypothetical protein
MVRRVHLQALALNHIEATDLKAENWDTFCTDDST